MLHLCGFRSAFTTSPYNKLERNNGRGQEALGKPAPTQRTRENRNTQELPKWVDDGAMDIKGWQHAKRVLATLDKLLKQWSGMVVFKYIVVQRQPKVVCEVS